MWVNPQWNIYDTLLFCQHVHLRMFIYHHSYTTLAFWVLIQKKAKIKWDINFSCKQRKTNNKNDHSPYCTPSDFHFYWHEWLIHPWQMYAPNTFSTYKYVTQFCSECFLFSPPTYMCGCSPSSQQYQLRNMHLPATSLWLSSFVLSCVSMLIQCLLVLSSTFRLSKALAYNNTRSLFVYTVQPHSQL